ncbi:hypothetical protein [Kitasatospora sp. McL0602]|uniref:hypothetical protein n=1 Tax=Kitasatospora sp. McL0602 TaxID=3439530 RepID=UPI003F8C4DFA
MITRPRRPLAETHKPGTSCRRPGCAFPRRALSKSPTTVRFCSIACQAWTRSLRRLADYPPTPVRREVAEELEFAAAILAERRHPFAWSERELIPEVPERSTTDGTL